MTKAGNQVAIFEPEVALQSTPMPHLATAIASQEIPATTVTAQTLLLFTSAPEFDRVATPAISKPALSSASQSHHTMKLPFRAPSNVKAFPDAIEVRMDLLLANQHNHG